MKHLRFFRRKFESGEHSMKNATKKAAAKKAVATKKKK